MPFDDWESFADPAIRLPYKGTEYELQPMSAQLGVWMRLQEAGEHSPLEDMSDQDQARAVLGPSYDRMVADGVPEAFVTRATIVAIAEWKGGRKAAEAMWKVGVDPEAAAAWAAAHGEKGSTGSSSTGEADETRKRASTNATASPRKPRQKRAKVSPGATSSDSGG